MKKVRNVIQFVGQLISILIFGLTGGLLFHFRIPGNKTFTDNDAGPIALVYGIFIIMGIGLFLNSLIFIQKNHWSKYRIGVLVIIIGLSMLIF